MELKSEVIKVGSLTIMVTNQVGAATFVSDEIFEIMKNQAREMLEARYDALMKTLRGLPGQGIIDPRISKGL